MRYGETTDIYIEDFHRIYKNKITYSISDTLNMSISYIDSSVDLLIIPDSIRYIDICLSQEPSENLIISFPYSIKGITGFKSFNSDVFKIKRIYFRQEVEKLEFIHGKVEVTDGVIIKFRGDSMNAVFNDFKADIVIDNSKWLKMFGCFGRCRGSLTITGDCSLSDCINGCNNFNVTINKLKYSNYSFTRLTDCTLDITASPYNCKINESFYNCENVNFKGEPLGTAHIKGGFSEIYISFLNSDFKRIIIPYGIKKITYPMGNHDTVVEIHTDNKITQDMYSNYDAMCCKLDWRNEDGGELKEPIKLTGLPPLAGGIRRISDYQLPSTAYLSLNCEYEGIVSIVDSKDLPNCKVYSMLNLTMINPNIVILRNNVKDLCSDRDVTYTCVMNLIIDSNVNVMAEVLKTQFIGTLFIVRGNKVLNCKEDITKNGLCRIVEVDSIEDAIELNKIGDENNNSLNKLKMLYNDSPEYEWLFEYPWVKDAKHLLYVQMLLEKVEADEDNLVEVALPSGTIIRGTINFKNTYNNLLKYYKIIENTEGLNIEYHGIIKRFDEYNMLRRAILHDKNTTVECMVLITSGTKNKTTLFISDKLPVLKVSLLTDSLKCSNTLTLKEGDFMQITTSSTQRAVVHGVSIYSKYTMVGKLYKLAVENLIFIYYYVDGSDLCRALVFETSSGSFMECIVGYAGYTVNNIGKPLHMIFVKNVLGKLREEEIYERCQ